MLTALLLVLVAFSAYAQIPSYISVCRRDDPNSSQCLRNSIHNLQPKLQQGILELNIPSLEPLDLDEIVLRSGSGLDQITGTLRNLRLWGTSNYQIQYLNFNVEDQTISMKSLSPYMYIEGNYDLDISLLQVRDKGQGIIRGNFTNYMEEYNIKYEEYMKNGITYIRFLKIQVRITPGNSLLDLRETDQNTNGGSNNFGNTNTGSNNYGNTNTGLNNFIRSNSDSFMRSILPSLEEGLSTRLTEIANSLASHFPARELFP